MLPMTQVALGISFMHILTTLLPLTFTAMLSFLLHNVTKSKSLVKTDNEVNGDTSLKG